MSSITIKTQYNGDIRRFNVDSSNGSLYASIQATIGTLYRLTGKTFTINYIDEEGDACCVGGDEETREALRFAADHGKVLKLNVVLTGDAAPVLTPLSIETPKAAAPLPATPAAALETKKPLVRPQVAFVTDVTIEEGSLQKAGSLITKIWEVNIENNNGVWPADVALVAVNGGSVTPISDAIPSTKGAVGSVYVTVPIRVPTDAAGDQKYEYHIVTDDGKPVDGDYRLWAEFFVRPAISAAFVSDVTIEDGSELAANSTVKKIWSIKNDGVEQWPAGSLLVHNDGTVLPSPLFESDVKGVAVPTAQPNETVQVAVHVVAPSTSGRHHGEFHLTKPDGSKFSNDYALWTQINVPVPTLQPHEVILSLPKWMEDSSVRAAVDKLRSGVETANASTQSSSCAPSKDVVHVGITCDGCNMSPIVGFRFKCSTCPDYDLCSSCESKSAANGGIAGHSGEHSFIKMKVPVRGHCGRRAESKATASTNWRAAPAIPTPSPTPVPVPVPAVATPKSTGLLPIPFAPVPAVLPKATLLPVPFAPTPVNKPAKKTVPKSQFTADITLPDGAQVVCGTVAVKRWSITNVGEEVWPEGTKLMFVGGALQPAPPSTSEPVSLSVVPLATPKQTVEVYARVQIPTIAGRHTGYFRLATADGKRFGHRLWLDVVAIAQPIGTTPIPVIGSSKLEVKAVTAVAVPPVVVAATPSPSVPATVVPVESASATKTKYAAELAQLKELGYRDENMLADLLHAAGGRVTQVVDWLVTPVA